jgi:DNA-binding GntR family transcriptional regulator
MGAALSSDLATLTPPPRETLQERVYEELRAAIMGGRFLPGQTLTIRAVAAALRTSTMPVREALRQLVAERALDTLANRSFGIPRLSRSRFQDVVTVRVEIEGYAAATAAKRIEPSVVDRLKEINQGLHAAEKIGDRNRYIEHNKDFHFAIYGAAGSEVLLPIIETLWLQTGPYIACIYSDSPHPKVGLKRHEGAIRALSKGDSQAARTMIAADITDAAAVILSVAQFSD